MNPKFACRQLLKNPGFAAAAVLTFALGIGVTVSVVALVRDVILAPPPYPDAGRIVLVSAERSDGQPHSRGWTAGHWHAFNEQTTAFEALACYEWAFDFLILPDGSESIRGMTVSGDYFEIIGARPLIGRAFSEGELKPKAQETVIILGHDLWQRRFNGDPEIVGKSVSLGRWPDLTVVGIMPPGLRFLPSPQNARDPSYDLHARVDYWLPAAPHPGKPQEGSLHVLGRLRASSSPAQARSQVVAILPRFAGLIPDFEGVLPSVRSITRVLNAQGEHLVTPLLVSVALVFLIACLNVSGLLFSRSLQRQQEYAVRSALGARPWMLLRAVLLETLLLAGLGGACGAALATVLLMVLQRTGGHGLPPLDGLTFSGSFAALCVGTALLATLTAAVLPAASTMRRQPVEVLAGAVRSTVGRGERWLLRGTAVLQMALTLTLLVGAGLLIRTVRNLANVQPGYQTENILTMSVTLVKGKWFDFHTRALQRVGALPGVESVAFGWGLPLTGNAWMGAVEAAEDPERPLTERAAVSIRAVTPDYFETTGMVVAGGRGFRETDAGSSANDIPGNAPFVAVINQALADACFPGRNPLGKRLRLSWRPEEPEIVGVVSNTLTDALTKSPQPELYFSLWQAPAWVKHLVVRAATDLPTLHSAIQRELRAIDPTVAIEQVKTLVEIRQESVAMQTFVMRLLAGFSCGAVLLALVALYGLLSITAGSRRKELAIRSALGAQRFDILRLVLGEGLRWLAAGALVGVALAFVLGSLLRSLLFGVQPMNPSVLGGAVFLFATVGLLACWLPARRAALVDPMEALRTE
jgi:putative ABC transport system permease protein